MEENPKMNSPKSPGPLVSSAEITPKQPPKTQEPVTLSDTGDNETGSKKRDQPSWLREIFSTIGILILAFGVALLLINFVFRSYQVDGPSMESTLQNADKLIIWKVPRTWARITGHDYIPKRGDVIVFTESGLSAFGQSDTKQLIKRVIGLPGDHLVIKDGTYIIYNHKHPNGFSPDHTLPYDRDNHIPTTTCSGQFCDITLGSDQLFVSGDNRPDSLDSRAFGPINANQIVGQLVLRIYPLSKIKTF